jgi:regulator of cell morphogenesis and NO signaling
MNTKVAANDPPLDDDDSAAWETQTPSALIEFILRRFHEPLRIELPLLSASARLVEAEGRENALCPRGLASHLEQIHASVESHLAKEEKILFPLILAGRGAMALMPIKVMMAEHEDHTVNLRRTRELTHDFTLPSLASVTWRNLYSDLQRFEIELNRHIHLENNILFAHAMGADDGTKRHR